MSQPDNGRMKLTPAQRRVLAQIAGARRVAKFSDGIAGSSYYVDGVRLSLLPVARLLELELVEEFIPGKTSAQFAVRLTEAGRSALA